MTDADLDQVVAIEQASFASPWLREHFEAELRAGHGWNRTLWVDRALAGYCCAWLLGPEVQLNDLAVAPARRGQGWGDFLMQALIRVAEQSGAGRISLEVRASNDPARALYARHGFVLAGRRIGYYPPSGEDALILERKIHRGVGESGP